MLNGEVEWLIGAVGRYIDLLFVCEWVSEWELQNEWKKEEEKFDKLKDSYDQKKYKKPKWSEVSEWASVKEDWLNTGGKK